MPNRIASNLTGIFSGTLIAGMLFISSCSAAIAVWAIQELRDPPKITWSGTVTDGRVGDGSKNLAKARVFIQRAETNELVAETISNVTGGDGKFELQFKWYGDAKYTLGVSFQQEYYWPSAYNDRLILKQNHTDIDLKFKPNRMQDMELFTWIGMISDSTGDSSNAVHGADVLIRYDVDADNAHFVYGDTTDEDGIYEVNNVPWYRYAQYSVLLVYNGHGMEPDLPENITADIRAKKQAHDEHQQGDASTSAVGKRALAEQFIYSHDYAVSIVPEEITAEAQWIGEVFSQPGDAVKEGLLILELVNDFGTGEPETRIFTADIDSGGYTLDFDWYPFGLYSVSIVIDYNVFELADFQAITPQLGEWSGTRFVTTDMDFHIIPPDIAITWQGKILNGSEPLDKAELIIRREVGIFSKEYSTITNNDGTYEINFDWQSEGKYFVEIIADSQHYTPAAYQEISIEMADLDNQDFVVAISN